MNISDLVVISAIDANENKENIITNIIEEDFMKLCFLKNFEELIGTRDIGVGTNKI